MRSLNKVVRHPSTRSCFLFTLFFLLSLITRPAVASLVLFDDAPQNGTYLWSTGSSISDYTTGSEPVAAGTAAIAMEAVSWTQAGLFIGQAPPAGHTILQARIYRVSGSGGKLMFRRGNNWLKIDLTETNNAHWKLDGQPGTNSFSDDTWHTIQIDLDGFGIQQGESIIAVGFQGPSGTGYYYMDEVSFEEATPPPFVLFDDTPQNGTYLWSTGSSISDYTTSGEPVASGSTAIAMEAVSWTQAGLNIGQAPPAGYSILEAKIYRVSGSGGSPMFRRGNNWLKINLNDANSANWTLDGQPGTSNFSDDTWHTIRIDLDAFGIEQGESVIAVGFQGPSGTGYYYMDDVAFVSTQTAAPIAPPIAGNWTLTFEDDFDGDILNPEKWKVGKQYLGQSGQAGTTAENIAVANGVLKITGEKRAVDQGTSTYNYASGEISTYGLFRQTYGYYETRLKYDAVQGLWPAFWLMPDRANYGNDDLRRQSLIKFDLSSVAQTVSSAVLRIKVASVQSSNTSLAIHRTLTTDWTENTVTWETKPQIDPQWFKQQFGVVANDVIEVDVTQYIQAQKATGDAASFALVDNYVKQQLVEIHSREAAATGDRPVLIVNGLNVTASEDASVRGGNYVTNTYPSETTLSVKTPWGNTSSTYDGGMEFDIMESLGIWGDDVNSHALHWDGYGSSHQSTGSGELNLTPTSDGYHTYGMYWEPGYVAMYVDGELKWTYANSRVGSVPSYLILSLQIGGWDGNGTILDNQLPADMEVDYVRVWSGTAD